ncbi:MAG: hypothetical protein DRJ61_11570, partial [Acidobacteria bacterium]
ELAGERRSEMRRAASLGLGFVPVVGDIKDGLEGVIGKDFIADEQLPPLGRALTLAAAALPIIPGKAVRKLGDVAELGWNQFQRLTRGVFRGPGNRRSAQRSFEALKDVLRGHAVDPAVVKIVRGDPDRVAVIGRWMGRRVEPTAEELRATGWFREVKTFEPSDAAENAWEELMRDYPGGVPDDEAVKSLMYRENEAWIRKIKGAGYTIFDVGELPGMSVSTFYEMEKAGVYGGR